VESEVGLEFFVDGGFAQI
jgi:hypothetical protein